MASSSFSNPTIELDQIDHQIIDLLRSDGRMTVSEIAKRLSMPETTTRYRVQRLIQSEAVKVLAWPNPEKLGKPNILIISMVVDNSRIRAIAEDFLCMDEVRYVAVITGRFNLMIDVFFGAHAELMAFFEKLQQIPGVISFESHFILDLLRAEYKYTLG